MVHVLYARGEYQAAYDASGRARAFAVMGVVLGLLLMLLGFFSAKAG
jgi:uncharacterized membrane protein